MKTDMKNMKDIRYYSNLLKLIKKSKSDDRNVILEHLNDDSIDFICEVIYNVINGKIRLTKHQTNKLRNKLREDKKCFRYLSKKGVKTKRRRKLIKQNGRGIGAILSIVLPIILELIANYFIKK
jgi:hypothetical protein